MKYNWWSVQATCNQQTWKVKIWIKTFDTINEIDVYNKTFILVICNTQFSTYLLIQMTDSDDEMLHIE